MDTITYSLDANGNLIKTTVHLVTEDEKVFEAEQVKMKLGDFQRMRLPQDQIQALDDGITSCEEALKLLGA